MIISCQSFDLPLRDPFTIARGTTTIQPTLIVRVEHEGLVGWGEATTNPYYGVTLQSMQRALASIAPRLASAPLDNPAEIWAELDGELSQCRFAQCALDCALWDIYAQMHGVPLWKLWGFDADDPRPPTCYTIGLDRPERMIDKMQARPGWPVYKIKVGADGGIDLVRRLRQATDAVFRVDANCSWSPPAILPLAEQLAELGVELIEQPLEADQYEAMRAVKGKSRLPLMADESCQVEADVDRCIEAFDAINIKLVKCGGITPARRMITRAKQNGLQVMVGCMTESSIGIAAGVHLLPLLDYADLDGALLLAEDLADGLVWDRGVCRLPQRPGLGIQPRNEVLERFSACSALG
ncbi:MAG: dipeptide epimerase [Planctomycetota bacterium]|nr:MAG: dipeptide epimerase [Planctomycetota bacterium]